MNSLNKLSICLIIRIIRLNSNTIVSILIRNFNENLEICCNYELNENI